MRCAVAIGWACLAAYLVGCEAQPYPPRPVDGERAPTQSQATVSAPPAAAPEAPEESDVFLATRQVAKRGPARDLRAAAFRYMNLRFSSGTLGDGTGGSTLQASSAPVKVTEGAKLAALEQLLESVRGLPQDSRRGSAVCVQSYETCRSGAADGWDAPHCSGPFLLCLADKLSGDREGG